jgi:hypothetical protein
MTTGTRGVNIIYLRGVYCAHIYMYICVCVYIYTYTYIHTYVTGDDDWDQGGDYYLSEGRILEVIKDEKEEPKRLLNHEDEVMYVCVYIYIYIYIQR